MFGYALFINQAELVHLILFLLCLDKYIYNQILAKYDGKNVVYNALIFDQEL
jgi:hypothetical protein